LNHAQHCMHPTALSRAQSGGFTRIKRASQQGRYPAVARRVMLAVRPPETGEL
jgi:hypothetical protein